MKESGEIRFTLRIPAEVIRRIDAFSNSASVSRNHAIVELVQLGLDADTAGIESALQIQAQLKRELGSLRALVVAAVDGADTACMLHLISMVRSGDIDSSEAIPTFASARKQIGKIKSVKKNNPADRKSHGLLEGLDND